MATGRRKHGSSESGTNKLLCKGQSVAEPVPDGCAGEAGDVWSPDAMSFGLHVGGPTRIMDSTGTDIPPTIGANDDFCIETWIAIRKNIAQYGTGIPGTVPPAPANGGGIGLHYFTDQHAAICMQDTQIRASFVRLGVGNQVLVPMPPQGQWIYAVINFDRNALQMDFYINCLLQGSAVIGAGTFNLHYGLARGFDVGGNLTYFPFWVSSLAFHNRLMTAHERERSFKRRAVYTLGTSDTMACYRMRDVVFLDGSECLVSTGSDEEDMDVNWGDASAGENSTVSRCSVLGLYNAYFPDLSGNNNDWYFSGHGGPAGARFATEPFFW